MSCPRKHPNGAARPGCRSDGPQHEEQGFVLWNQRYATGGEPVQAKPCGRALPGLDRTSPFAFCSTHAKRSQTNNRTFHLLFKPDILTCYEQAEVIGAGQSMAAKTEKSRAAFFIVILVSAQ